jgi:hypothetical protein
VGHNSNPKKVHANVAKMNPDQHGTHEGVGVEGCMGGMTMGVDGVVLIMGFVSAIP